MTWVIDLPYDRPPLSLNQRQHWAVTHRITQELKLVAKVKARHIPELDKCSVELVWFVTDRRRRDVDNPVPTLKALCDGLVDAEIVPDDTPEYMAKLPVRIEHGKKKGLQLIVKDIGDSILRDHASITAGRRIYPESDGE